MWPLLFRMIRLRRKNHKIVSDSSKEKRGKYCFSAARRKEREVVLVQQEENLWDNYKRQYPES